MINKKPLMSKTQTICLVILWILFILLAIIMAKQIITNKKTKEPVYEEIKVTDKLIQDQMLLLNINYGYGMDNLLDKLYSGNFKSSTLEDYEKIYLALNNKVPTCDSKENISLNLEELNELVQEKFPNFKLNKEDLEAILRSEILKDAYNISYDGNKVTLTLSCQKANEDKALLTNIVSAKSNSEYLKITLKIALKLRKNIDGDIMYDYYLDVLGKSIVEHLAKIDEDKIIWDKYYSYEISFKKENDSYTLDTITKLD